MEPNVDDSIIYRQDDLMPSSFVMFEDMRRKGELIDITITIQKRPFSAHRLVLAATIPYFRTAFADSKEDISLGGIDPNLLQSVFDFAYSGEIKISLKNVLSLLTATKILEIKKIHDACWDFLKKRLRCDNVWEVRQLADEYQCLKAMSSSDQFIRENFVAFSRSESFLALPFPYLKEVLSREDLKVGNEEEVFEAVIRWVKASPSERRDLFHELFALVRIGLLTHGYLGDRVSVEELVRSRKQSRDFVEKAKSYHLFPKNRSHFPEFTAGPRIYKKEFDHPNRDVNITEYGIYAVSWDSFSISVKYLDVENDKQVDLTTTMSNQIHQAVAFREIIYLFLSRTIHLFNVKTLQWGVLDLMHHTLLESGIVLHEDMIYVIGGDLNSDISGKIRCFDPQQNKWLEERKMIRGLEYPGVTSLKELIYVSGGREKMRGALDAVVGYNPQTKNWKKLSPMLSKRFDHSCGSIDEKIYISGGFSLGGILHTAEIYDPLTNQWHSISPMKYAKSRFTTVSHHGKLYALGRLSVIGSRECLGSSPVMEVETYNPQNDKWETISDAFPSEIFLVKAEVHSEVIRKGLSTARKSSTVRQDSGMWIQLPPPEANLRFIEETKKVGNDLYKNKNYTEASEHYTRALFARTMLSLGTQPDDGIWEQLKEIEIPLLLNLSLCRLMEKDYISVIRYTTSVLQMDRDNVKALYRRAKAHMGTENLEQAESDYRRALDLNCSLEPLVKEDLQRIERNRKQKNM